MLRSILRGLTEKSLQPLPDPGCPVRIVWAQRDRVIPYEQFGVPIMRQVPSAELVILNGVGHVPMSDDPALVAHVLLTGSDERSTRAGFTTVRDGDPPTLSEAQSA